MASVRSEFAAAAGRLEAALGRDAPAHASLLSLLFPLATALDRSAAPSTGGGPRRQDTTRVPYQYYDDELYNSEETETEEDDEDDEEEWRRNMILWGRTL